MKKKAFICILILALTLVLGACRLPWEKGKEEEHVDGYIYYLNEGRSDLNASGFNFDSKTGQDLVDEITRRLTISADSADVSPLPDGVVIDSAVIEDGCLHISFNTLFSLVEDRDRLLCLAALVRSYTQVPGVSRVSFYVGDTPLTDEQGQSYADMTAEDFLCLSDKLPEVSDEKVLLLYYGDDKGENLVEEKVPVRPSIDESLVRLIVRRLIEGPAYEEEERTVPEDTAILSIDVIGLTAYVNLSSEFSDNATDLSPELAVYSIVNSLTANTDIEKVQILINGTASDSYGGQIDLRFPLEQKRSLIK